MQKKLCCKETLFTSYCTAWILLLNTGLVFLSWFGNFLGIEQPLFPDLGARNLRMFTGVDQELLESLIQDRRRGELGARPVEQQGRLERQPPDHLPANMSVSRNGSCMIIDGL